MPRFPVHCFLHAFLLTRPAAEHHPGVLFLNPAFFVFFISPIPAVCMCVCLPVRSQSPPHSPFPHTSCSLCFQSQFRVYSFFLYVRNPFLFLSPSLLQRLPCELSCSLCTWNPSLCLSPFFRSFTFPAFSQSSLQFSFLSLFSFQPCQSQESMSASFLQQFCQ